MKLKLNLENYEANTVFAVAFILILSASRIAICLRCFDMSSTMLLWGVIANSIVWLSCVLKIDRPAKKKKISKWSNLMGPSTWKGALRIAEQWGEGWRLPTDDELYEKPVNFSYSQKYWASKETSPCRAVAVRKGDSENSVEGAHKYEKLHFWLVQDVRV